MIGRSRSCTSLTSRFDRITSLFRSSSLQLDINFDLQHLALVDDIDFGQLTVTVRREIADWARLALHYIRLIVSENEVP